MFSKAKRFEVVVPGKTPKAVKKQDNEKPAPSTKPPTPAPVGATKPKTVVVPKKPFDTLSQCSSSIKSFVTPKPSKTPIIKAPCSLKKTLANAKPKDTKAEEIIKSQEVEIRNKDQTIIEYNKLIEELKHEISDLQIKIKQKRKDSDVNEIDQKISQISLNEKQAIQDPAKNNETIEKLSLKIAELELQCEKLEQEASGKQIELSSLEEVIIIRDSLCKDLQDKLTSMENCLEETRQSLEMVKGHHALALEANESIRTEYKAELEKLKTKLEDEKQAIIAKSKVDQETVKLEYNELIEAIKEQMLKEKHDVIQELEQQLVVKDQDMKAKLDLIDEATHEKLRLCEIQFEERTQNLQDHCAQQQKKIQYLENDVKKLKYSVSLAEEKYEKLRKELIDLKHENEILVRDRADISHEINKLKEEFKQKQIDFENEKNKLTLEVDKAIKEKNKFEMSLSVTRDIVEVLTLRLRESDSEVEHLEDELQTLTNTKEVLEKELATYKKTLDSTAMECNEYKEALVNILKSKAALAKEHTRIMEHNVTLIESLQNVEQEAYRELGSIKCEMIEDMELIKKESKSQIQMLQEEVEKKRMLCVLATEHAGQATAAAEQSRVLLTHAANEITRLEAESQRYQQEIHDQQSLVVEVSLLRQENEELTMTVAKQSSIIDKLKKEIDMLQTKPKSQEDFTNRSPKALLKKAHKIGKENMQVSPLRERNSLIS